MVAEERGIRMPDDVLPGSIEWEQHVAYLKTLEGIPAARMELERLGEADDGPSEPESDDKDDVVVVEEAEDEPELHPTDAEIAERELARRTSIRAQRLAHISELVEEGKLRAKETPGYADDEYAASGLVEDLEDAALSCGESLEDWCPGSKILNKYM